MATDSAADRVVAEALDRYWDAVVAWPVVHPGGRSVPDHDLDPALAAAVRRLHAVDNALRPEAAFSARLRRDLLDPETRRPEERGAPPWGGRPGSGILRPGRTRRPLVALAVAAAVLLAVFGSGFDGRGWLPRFAAVSPTAAASAVDPTATAGASRRPCLATPTPPTSTIVAEVGTASSVFRGDDGCAAGSGR